MPATPPRIALAAEAAAQRLLLMRAQRGFTLIELIVVMIVIGILAIVALPRFSLLSGYDEVGYRDKVKSALEFARKSSVAQRRYSCAVVGGNDLTLTIETAIPESTAGSCPFARLLTLPSPDGKCGGATNKVCHPNNVTLTNGTGSGTIRFDAQGRPVSGAGTYIVTGDSASTITVETETGYVH